jgi:hypothetical protein
MPNSIFIRGIDRLKRSVGLPTTKRGEISDDDFYHALVRNASDPSVRTILEIGSSTGDGSTRALVEGMAANPSNPRVFCVEALTDRFQILRERYKDNPRVHCYNVCSVGVDQVESEKHVRKFRATCTRCAGLEDLLKWRAWELNYVTEHQIETRGIEKIKRENGIQDFDLVLLDGSEFTGRAELDAVYGSRIIALDDVSVLKNCYNLLRLTFDDAYELVESDMHLRNGYAIFRKRSAASPSSTHSQV